ncbi:hypothetical protein JTB14_010767 [Gonioctena quinquepunctata]|nr:hypothetical protein JTB14_010767 [Gonioctena quinquepunctata]
MAKHHLEMNIIYVESSSIIACLEFRKSYYIHEKFVSALESFEETLSRFWTAGTTGGKGAFGTLKLASATSSSAKPSADKKNTVATKTGEMAKLEKFVSWSLEGNT